jgi:Domain of unknown function (DUF1990)
MNVPVITLSTDGSAAAKPSQRRSRWLITAGWPFGVVLTSWNYMWRTTPMHRRETRASLEDPTPELLKPPSGVGHESLQGHQDGHGPLFHRRYRTRIRNCSVDAVGLMQNIQGDLNAAAPRSLARFQRLRGERGRLAVGDEYVVRMPGPWDGPVRVVDVQPKSFRLATLAGHLEAGQIEFRTGDEAGSELVFEIESWARSSSLLVNLLYHRLRMAKEVQAHMWISFLEGVVRLAGGKMTGGIELDTERIEAEAGQP